MMNEESPVMEVAGWVWIVSAFESSTQSLNAGEADGLNGAQ